MGGDGIIGEGGWRGSCPTDGEEGRMDWIGLMMG